MAKHTIAVHRIYEDPDGTGGYRVLVDRLWPRGFKKERVRFDAWLKDLAPWLPAWLPRLTVHGIAIGGGRLEVTIAGCGAATEVEAVRADGIVVLHGAAVAPLWGEPPGPREEG